jgi:ABC-2 type transport system ATP-binding protein
VVRTRDIEAACLALTGAGYPAEILQDGSIELKNSSAVEHPDQIANLLVQVRVPPTQLMVEEEDLEQYFLRLVG